MIDFDILRKKIQQGEIPNIRFYGWKEEEGGFRYKSDIEASFIENELRDFSGELAPLVAFKRAIDTVNARFSPHKVLSLDHWDEYEVINGKLNGRVWIGVWIPIVDGEPVYTLNNKMIEGCTDVKNINGKLNGRVRICGNRVDIIHGKYEIKEGWSARWLPVINGRLIEQNTTLSVTFRNNIINCKYIQNINNELNGIIDGKVFINGKIDDSIKGSVFYDVRIINNKLNGSVICDDDSYFSNTVRWPIIDGQLIKNIDGHKIISCGYIYNIDGKLNGEVKIANGLLKNKQLLLPVIDGELIYQVDGQKIISCRDIRNIKGRLNGIVVLEDNRYVPVVDGKIIEEIDGHYLRSCLSIKVINDKLNGQVYLNDDRGVPVINGKIIEEIDGWLIQDCKNIRNENNALSGHVKIGGRWLPVIGGVLVEKVEGLTLVEMDRDLVFSTAGGMFNGIAKFKHEDGRIKYRVVVLGEFVDIVND